MHREGQDSRNLGAGPGWAHLRGEAHHAGIREMPQPSGHVWKPWPVVQAASHAAEVLFKWPKGSGVLEFTNLQRKIIVNSIWKKRFWPLGFALPQLSWWRRWSKLRSIGETWVYFQNDSLDQNEKLSQILAILASPRSSGVDSLNPLRLSGFQPSTLRWFHSECSWCWQLEGNQEDPING